MCDAVIWQAIGSYIVTPMCVAVILWALFR